MANLNQRNATLAAERQLQARRRGMLAVLAAMVAFATAFALMMPAISMTAADDPNRDDEAAASDVQAAPEDAAPQAEDVADAPDVQSELAAAGVQDTADSELEASLDQEQDPAAQDALEGAGAEGAGAASDGEGAADAAAAGEGSDGAQEEGTESAAQDAGDEASLSDDADAAGEGDAGASAMPAQHFEETVWFGSPLKVVVDAPEGAFPAGTSMKVEIVPSYNVEGQVRAAVATRTDAQVEEIQAVDITFRNAEGAEIEPAKQITVRMASDFIEDNAPMLVHVDDYGNASMVNPLDEYALAARNLPANDDELLFDSSDFSTYALAAAKDATSSNLIMSVGDTETLTPVLIGAYQGDLKWTSADSGIVSVTNGANTKSATLQAKGAGETTVTLSYKYGDKSNKVNKEGSVVYQITVAAATSGDESDYEAKATESGLTVTVKETGRTKKLTGYTLVVDDAQGDYSDDAANLAAYHIYLRDDATGQEAANLGSNLKLDVTLTYATLPSWFNDAKEVKHYKNGASRDIANVKFNSSAKTISFTVSNFSDFVIRSGSSTTTGGGTSVSTQQGSILDGKTYFNDANEWQIVSGEYSNNAGADKTLSSDGRASVQKSIIPTEIENEFLVYLSIDYNQASAWTSFFENATYRATSSANFHGQGGQIVDAMTGNWNVEVSATDKSKPMSAVFDIYDSAGKYITSQVLYWGGGDGSNSNNFTIFIELSNGKFFVVGAKLSKKADAGNTVYNINLFDSSVEQYIYQELSSKIDINGIVDQMGTYVSYVEGSATGDLGSATYDSSTKTLTWIPAVKPNPAREEIASDNKVTVWYRNAAELLYRVRLDVTKDGFNSCAQHMNSSVGDAWSYKVNERATLTYDGGKTAAFPVPYVRGLLYDVTLKKVDESGNPLEGAQFSLTGTSNTTSTDVAAAAAANIPSSQLKSGSDGYVTITGLPWGAYTLTETKPPSGYSADGAYKNGKQVTLCYTSSSSNLANNGSHKIVKDGQKNYLEVVNKKNVITFTKQVDTQGDILRTDIDHTIYIALWDNSARDYVRDDSGKIVNRPIVITNGVPTPKTVTFEGVDVGFYDVYELSSIEGDGVALSAGHDTFESQEGNEFQLTRVDGDNDADLRSSNTANVTLTNVYSYPTTMDFVANKRWADGTWQEVSAPAGAQVAFTLYRKTDGGAFAAVPDVAPIILNGAVDSAGESGEWQAMFSDLPKTDGSGNKYTYAVRETNCTNADYTAYQDRSSAAPMAASDYMDSNGGTIWNKQKTTQITVKKVNDKGAFLPGATFELYRVVSDGTSTHDVKVGSAFTVNTEGGVTVGGLVSGDYKLTELSAPDGYVILSSSIEFTVNATGTGDVIGWAGGAKPERVYELQGTGNDTMVVSNTPGKALPTTGGSGTIPYTLGGLLVVAAALVYGFRMRLRERRFSR